MLHDKQTNKYELYKSCDGILNQTPTHIEFHNCTNKSIYIKSVMLRKFANLQHKLTQY